MHAEPELLKGIFEAVTPLRQTVIWKLSEKDQKLLKALELELPQHVHPVKFVPQNDLLGHPAVQAFVTQGGSNSMYEVINMLPKRHTGSASGNQVSRPACLCHPEHVVVMYRSKRNERPNAAML